MSNKQNPITQKGAWGSYYKNWKEVWRDPTISVHEKVILRNIELYRSDSEGWFISARKMARDLGISKSTAVKYINKLIGRGLVLTSNRIQRKRRKLRLSGLLRNPVWVATEPKDWSSTKTSKYQKKYQINKDLDNSNKKSGKVERILRPEEAQKRIQEIKTDFKR